MMTASIDSILLSTFISGYSQDMSRQPLSSTEFSLDTTNLEGHKLVLLKNQQLTKATATSVYKWEKIPVVIENYTKQSA